GRPRARHLHCFPTRRSSDLERLPDSGYLRAKVAQETEIESGGVPFTILRATQFFEFLSQIVDSGAEGDQRVRLSTGLMQLVAARSEEHTSELQSPDHLVSRP